ncbi:MULTISPECIES: type IX secretion system anionic LPS delivery protein PorZ [Mesonia]|uniref:Uncharacterized protein n=1 Tax=Mesonia oceanica TaxID=2687242 RepID=A0AC61Y4K5_9FLAO|nr:MULTISPECIES: two-component regulator propeller domain-containing protein [Mesonia]MAN26367.1 surface protein [Mesonia sp.]MBJ97503.1 surface protein [Flavobacteriaceae bacterium]VVU98977.1 hypothetical protein FVB9532_00226 [Mesonia oceanica]|tara:strand:+ start:9572 stop:11878 length:2307 start_codon:yes stop_codon:yes gene_type:complete
MKIQYIFLLILLTFSSVNGQDYSNNWEDFFSYYNIRALHTEGNTVFAAAENAVFTYKKSTGEVKKITSVQGIAGDKISAIHYSSNYNVLAIGYQTGLINIYQFSSGNALQVIDITEKETVSPDKRRINDFYEYQGRLLVSTNYGISEYNLANLEFGDTYFIGNAGEQLQVNEITVRNNTIFAATQGGSVKYAGIDNPNLIDFNQWQQTNQTPSSIKNIFNFNNAVYAIGSNNNLYKVSGNNSAQIENFNINIRDASVSNNQLVITFSTGIRVYNENLNLTFNLNNIQDFQPDFSSAVLLEDQLFVGDNKEGLVGFFINATTEPRYLSPIGPLRNNVFHMEAIPNELWVVYGDYDLFYNPYPLDSYGISHLENGEWINIPFEEVNAESLVNIAINPNNINQVFISSYIDGLLQIQDNEVVNLYNQDNSPIEELIDGGAPLSNDTRVNGISFDRNGILWGNVSRVQHALFNFSPANSTFNIFDISEAIPEPEYYSENLGYSDIVIDNSGNVYFGSYEYGVIGYQPSSNTFAKVVGGENQGNLSDDYITTLALDNNNQLWIGTLRGLRVLYSPSSMFTNPNTQAQEIIILDDDGVAQELLAGASIADIEVDGNNNKWIATESGAFYLSSNGQETIYNFTTKNSPLPTNTVTDIEVDGSSGRVYFGTPQGIVAFNGTATSSQETLENVRAFPNPVRPNYSGMVTIDGLMENANVKITDIEGNLVYEEVSQGGSIQWDTRAFGKHKVASGVYMVLITSADQLETQVTKIMVIR